MKLSEAIRLGGIASDGETKHKLFEGGKTCAMGGALLAAGRLWFIDVAGVPWGYEAPECLIGPDPFAGTRGLSADCPVCPAGTALISAKVGRLEGVIFHLWDTHGWSREQIADWVEGIEREQDVPQEQAAEAVVAE